MLLSAFALKSQVNCVKFNDTIGCAPFTVNIEYCGPLKADGTEFPTIYTFDKGLTPTTNKSHEYVNAGIYDLTQLIAINEGVTQGTFDTTFKDAFRIVSTPEIQFQLTPCHNKLLHVNIDSSSYDFYVITNNINSNSDTLIGFGDKSLDFSGTTEGKVDITIQGLYYSATCSSTTSGTSELIDNMLPLSISTLEEYPVPNIKFESAGPFTHSLNLVLNESIVHSQVWSGEEITNSFSSPISSYNKIDFKVSDVCNNQLDVISTNSFTSSTSFQNNLNTTTETSPVFNPASFNFLKQTTDSFNILLTGEDSNITCNDTNCYYLRTDQSINGYDFTHFSSGTCGKSFSNDIPKHQLFYRINNRKEDSLTIHFNNPDKFLSIELNSKVLEEINNEITLPYTESCINFKFQNTCNVWSSDTTLCPLTLSLENNSLIWNSIDSNIYHIIWEDNFNERDTLFFNSISSLQSFSEDDYPSQEFCLFVTSEKDKSESNQLCFKSETFVFIPDIASESELLLIKDRFLEEYTLSLYDLNGNLIREIFPSKKSLSGLKSETYFYILQGVSEDGIPIERKGSIIIR